MNCRRAFELDLAGFLANPGAEEFASFRSHYPECRDCAAEVQAWTELHLQLRSGGPEEGHPSPELLLRLQEQPTSLSPGERQSLQRHAAACVSCRDELGALRSFDFGSLHETAPRTARGVATATHLAAVLRRLFWHPAFAYGLVLVLSLPLLLSEGVRRTPSTPADRKPATAPESELKDAPSVAAKQAQLDEAASDVAAAPGAGPVRVAAPGAPPVRVAGNVSQQVGGKVEVQFADSGRTLALGEQASIAQRKEKLDKNARQEAAGARGVGGSETARRPTRQEPPGTEALRARLAPAVPAEEDADESVGLVTSGFDEFRGVGSIGEDVRAQERATVLDLEADGRVELSRSDLGTHVLLRLPLSEEALRLGRAEIRIQLRNTAQELSQRFRFGPETEHLEMSIDAALLAPGVYAVGLHVAGGGTLPVETFSFSVR